jgi:hypothetical protein
MALFLSGDKSMSLMIRKGTIVIRCNDGERVRLIADVFIDKAERQGDFFIYGIRGYQETEAYKVRVEEVRHS